MAEAQLEVGIADGICRVTFRRPEAFNALDETMARGLVQALEEAGTDEAVRVVVLTGSGGAFSAGADLSAGTAELFTAETMDGANSIVRAVVRCPVPVIAAVNGIAAGVGASICFAADLAVAAESAAFLLAFARIGLMPDGGASLTVAASAGRAKAMRMALLAEPLPAADAYDAGLVSHLVADDDLEPTVDRIARRLASGPPRAFAATKAAINAATLPGLDAALEREKAGQLELFATDDAVEGVRAFVEKRRPSFRGG
jgi:enoyl-CoA hydratase